MQVVCSRPEDGGGSKPKAKAKPKAKSVAKGAKTAEVLLCCGAKGNSKAERHFASKGCSICGKVGKVCKQADGTEDAPAREKEGRPRRCFK